MTSVAIVLAGGTGSRMEGDANKVFASVCGRPLLAWSTRTFGRASSIDHLVVVARAGEHDRVAAILRADDLDARVHIATGGATRQDSEQAGLEVLSRPDGPRDVDLVLIHDAARPFATTDLISQVVDATADVGGAVPALPLGSGVYRAVTGGRLTAQSDDLFRVQTPQGFQAGALLDAYRHATDDGFAGVDTSETVQRYTSLEVAIVPGEHDNIKVTFAADLAAAEQIAVRRQA